MPWLTMVDEFVYPDAFAKPLPLDPVSERLISPHLPFMQV
jgi:hypothetical protein